MHDEEAYPDPSVFCPDRFEDPKRNSELGINPLPDAVFGFGRRYIVLSSKQLFSLLIEGPLQCLSRAMGCI